MCSILGTTSKTIKREELRPFFDRTIPRGPDMSRLIETPIGHLKVEVIVAKIPVQKVIEAAKKALYTGHIGDGKIFIYNVSRVVKVRTGEEGVAALQDVE